MNRAELLGRLERLKLSKEDYWLVTGGAMVLYGLRAETGDIDLGCTTKLADELEAKGFPVTRTPDGNRKICLSDDVEIFENWLYDCVEMCAGIPVISLRGLMAMKQALGREKDRQDVARIAEFLKAAQQSDLA